MTIKRFLLTLALLAMTATASAESKQKLPAPIKALQARGVQIVGTFKAPGGLTGYAGIMGRQPLAIYLTEDGQHAIVGSMINGKGDLVDQDTLQQMVAGPMSKHIWAQLEHSTWVPEGAANAPRTVYVFSDSNCPYCHLFWMHVQPWVKSGKVQLRHVLVGIIGKNSPNKAAAILTADNPEQAFIKNEQQFSKGGITPLENIPAEIQRKLSSNSQLMGQLGLGGTPAIVYRDDQGHVQFWPGVPSEQAMTEVLGQIGDG